MATAEPTRLRRHAIDSHQRVGNARPESPAAVKSPESLATFFLSLALLRSLRPPSTFFSLPPSLKQG